MGRMETIVRDLMTSPAVTCAADDTLAEAAGAMQQADTGSVVVTDDGKVVGILTERDLLRAAAGQGNPDRETGSALDDGAPGRARSRRAGGRGVGEPDLAPLPPPARRRRRPVRRRGVAARPHGRGPHPARRRDQRRRAGRPRGRRRGRDHDRRRARAGGLLPLPAVLGRRPGRDSARSRTCGISSSAASCPTLPPRPRSAPRCGGAAPCRRACTPCCRPWRGAARRSTCCAPLSRCWRRSSAGGRPTTSGPTSSPTRPSGCARWCRRSSPRRTACGRATSRSSRGTTSASPPTTSTC